MFCSSYAIDFTTQQNVDFVLSDGNNASNDVFCSTRYKFHATDQPLSLDSIVIEIAVHIVLRFKITLAQ